MTDGYSVATLAELEAQSATGPRWASIRAHFDIESFGVNAWTATDPGQAVISEHDEVSGGVARHEELYVVVSGRATFTVDDETLDAPAGTIVFVRDPAARRKAVADEAGTTILAIGAPVGEAFAPSNWERSAPALGYFATEEYDKALEVLEDVHREHPDDQVVLYNLACAESRLGRTADALEHLRHSVEGNDRLRDLARTDPDLEPIRNDPAFGEVVG